MKPAGLRFLLIIASCCTSFLSGCGISSKPTVQDINPVAHPSGVSGYVHGGQQPVVGAQVYLYAVATTDGGTATSLLKTPGFVLTDLNGNFTLPTNDYTCPAGAYVYFLAIGGNPGLTTGVNSEIALAAGLGPCSSLTSSSFFTINEVTTAAFAYSLSSYATSDTQIGTASDLSAPFTNITNLVDPTHGTALPNSYNLITQQAKLDSLSNAIAGCVNSNGIGTPCSTLMGAANASPANTFQAALKIAQNPTANPSTIFGLATANAVFQPALTSAPTDWTITATNLSNAIVADANTYYFNTSLGNIFIELRPDVAPQNVANFLSFVNSGAYTNMFFHRSVSGFILQGGGYTFTNGTVSAISPGGPVPGEVNLPNLRGTLAMANAASQNDATSQFFFNVEDNFSLDTTSGGYTVIGSIVSVVGSDNFTGDAPAGSATQGLAVMDAINAEPAYNLSANLGADFQSVPLLNYTSGSSVGTANLIFNTITPQTNVATTVATPTIYPAAGTYASLPTVTIRDNTPGAVIYYAVNYSPPPFTLMFMQYTGPFQPTSDAGVVTYATAPGYPNQSSHNSAGYTLGTVTTQPQTAMPVISPNGGSFSGSQLVTITDSTSGSAIAYTLDGTSPSGSNGIAYTTPFTISSSVRVIASATTPGYTPSTQAQAIFTQQ